MSRGSGFFATDRLRSVQSGDFLTSPEVSALFGETLAAFVEARALRIGDPFTLVEAGAGSGSLLRPLLARSPVDVIAVEASPAARIALEEMLPDAGVSDRLPPTIRGVVLANELLDNLPMALAQKVDGGWRERWVGASGADLEMVDSDPRPAVVDWLDAYAGAVEDGGWVEVQLAGDRLAHRCPDTAGDRLGGDHRLRRHRREPGPAATGWDLAHLPGPPSRAPPARRARGDRHHRRRQLHGVDRHRDPPRSRCQRSCARTTSWPISGFGSVCPNSVSPSWRRHDRATRWSDYASARSRTEAETLLHPRGLGDFRVLVATI